MTIRYSGDAEVRMRYEPETRSYHASVVDPYSYGPGARRWRGVLTQSGSGRGPTDPLIYDRLALRFIAEARAWAKREGKRQFMVDEKRGRVRIRRVFQAPCPIS